MFKAYMPIVATPAKSTKQLSVELFNLIANHPKQRRDKLIWDDRLYEIALPKLIIEAETDNISHCTNGICPNRWVLNGGYLLPEWYPPDGNSIESGGSGQPTSHKFVNLWELSPPHRLHLLGNNEFFRRQEKGCCVHVQDERYKFVGYAIFWSVGD